MSTAVTKHNYANTEKHEHSTSIITNLKRPRQGYLELIGLLLDPFSEPVAEQELSLSYGSAIPQSGQQSHKPSFFSYFVFPPPPSGSDRTLLQELRSQETSFIFGRPGAGKTTLRLILENSCRTELDQTAVVTYTLSEDTPNPWSISEHLDRLAQNIAIDLFIQIIEQFNPLNPPPTLEQKQLLAKLFAVNCVRRAARQILTDTKEITPEVGLAAYWPMLDRTMARYVYPSSELSQLLTEGLALWETGRKDNMKFGQRNAIQQLWQTGKAWGFRQMFILIDGVDARERKSSFMWPLISPLFAAQREFATETIFLKWFLPLELKQFVWRHKDLLPVNYFQYIIKWNNASLRQLLQARFEAAQSRYIGFDDLAAPDVSGQLDDRILEASQYSPRHLLQICDSLINAHVARDPADPYISEADWERAKALRGYKNQRKRMAPEG